MKCWNSAFNAQGSRVIIVIVQVGVVKMYVAEVVKKKEGRMKLSLPPNQAPSPFFVNANVLFCRLVFESHPVYDQTQGFGAVFSLLYIQLQ
jgi:hypothetical protein